MLTHENGSVHFQFDDLYLKGDYQVRGTGGKTESCLKEEERG